MAAARRATQSIMLYRRQHGETPRPHNVWCRLDVIRNRLQPVYGYTVVAKDGWNRDLLYASDGKHFVVASLGADGISDYSTSIDVRRIPESPIRRFRAPGPDIVMSGPPLGSYEANLRPKCLSYSAARQCF